MKTSFLCLLLLWRSGRGGEPNDVSPEQALVKAAVVVCTGTIDNGLFKSIQRRTETAVEAGASYVIYEIGTYGGMVEAADEIAKYFIRDVGLEGKVRFVLGLTRMFFILPKIIKCLLGTIAFRRRIPG